MKQLTHNGFHIAVYNGLIVEDDLKKELKLAKEQLNNAGIHVNISAPMPIDIVNPLNKQDRRKWLLKGIFLKNEQDMNYFLLINNKFHRWTEEKFWDGINKNRNSS